MDEDDDVDNDIIEYANTKTVKKKRFLTKTVKKKHQPKQVIVPVSEDNDETVDNNSDKIYKVLDILNKKDDKVANAITDMTKLVKAVLLKDAEAKVSKPTKAET